MSEGVKFGPDAVETLGGAVAEGGLMLGPVEAFGTVLGLSMAEDPT